MWQHVQLSEQIRPWDTLACCWDVKQQTTNQPPFPLSNHTSDLNIGTLVDEEYEGEKKKMMMMMPLLVMTIIMMTDDDDDD